MYIAEEFGEISGVGMTIFILLIVAVFVISVGGSYLERDKYPSRKDQEVLRRRADEVEENAAAKKTGGTKRSRRQAASLRRRADAMERTLAYSEAREAALEEQL